MQTIQTHRHPNRNPLNMKTLKLLLIGLLLALPSYAQINPLDNRQGATVPAYRITNVTPNDNYEFNVVNRAIWIGTGGNLAVVTYGGDDVTIPNVQDGSLLPLIVKTIKSTGTTAQNIQIWW
jgi:hypothetical protein